jgi:multisubunit Na+/H+ antiporter MnhC subunit
MKAKNFTVLIIIALLFLLGVLWLLAHAYIIVTFWVALKIMGVALIALLLTFYLGRWTKRNQPKPPTQA